MDPRLVQLTRLLHTPLESHAAARAAVSARHDELAAAFVLEAIASDDVTSAASALDYLETRLAYLGDIVGTAAAASIRARFSEAVAAW